MLTAFLLGRKIGRKIGRIRSLDYIVAYLQGRINLKDWGKKRGRLGENSMLYTLRLKTLHSTLYSTFN